jgi:hypothetical protein|tara:strand:+ start:829 stop:1068 length:240 start_codon:yes stop_codon:yes gene_type:complete
MESIEERLSKIEEKIEIILDLLQKDVKPNCDKMGNHISFVEGVYDNVKSPLDFICNKVNNIRGIETNNFHIEDKSKIYY